jgi:alpha-L-arabinofuranosidase
MVLGVIVAFLLLIPIAYSSYIVPIAGDDLEVELVMIEQVPSPNVTVPEILGVSIDWTDNAYGLYDDLSGLLNPAPVSQLINLDPSHMRFPATRLSQVYDWTQGVGNRNERGENPVHGGERQSCLFGTDEVMKLVNHAGSKAVMVVNSNTGKDSIAADWVSYCNDNQFTRFGRERAANGYYSPYGIKDWEIGYEPYSPRYWRDPGGSEVGAGTLYGELVKNYSVAMKTIDPTIKIGAWMVLHPDMELTSADRSWNINFLNAANGQFDIGTGDLYYFDYVVVKVHLPDISQLLNFPDLFRYSYAMTFRNTLDDLAQLRGLLANNPRKEGPIPLAIASFEPDFSDEGWNTQAPSMAASAVVTADMAMQFMRFSLEQAKQTMRYACYGELNSPTYSSLMINPDFEATDAETWGQSPNYLAFELATRLHGGVPLIVTELEGPDFDVTRQGDLSGLRDVPVVSAFAVGDTGDGTAWVLLVNRDLERSVKCRMSLDMTGVSTTMNLSVRSIRFDSLLATNLAGEDVTAPLPTPKERRTVVTSGFSVTIERAGVTLLVLESRGVG